MSKSTSLKSVKVKSTCGEASALLPCENESVLAAHDFERGFWAVLDEGPVEKAVVLVGRKPKKKLKKGWKLKRLKTEVRPEAAAKCTDDAETMVRHNGTIYILGSQFGDKDGPLDPARAFVARFREDALTGRLKKSRVQMEIACRPMLLHRAANDALRAAGVPLIPLGPTVSSGYVEKTLRYAYDEEAAWGPLVRVEDWPLNIEGGAFLPDGSCLLGLRFPVTNSGQPILLRCRGLDTLFDEEPRLEMSVAGIIAHGQRDRAVGVRGLQPAGERLHLLTGPIGSVDKTSSVALDYPGSALAACEHWSLAPDALEQGGVLEASLVRRFEDQSIEGLAPGRDGEWFYSVDVAGAVELRIAG